MGGREGKNQAARFALIDGVRTVEVSPHIPKMFLAGRGAIHIGRNTQRGMGKHFGRSAFAKKVVRARYYWPHTYKDAENSLGNALKC